MLDKNPFSINDFKGLNRGSEAVDFGAEYQDSIPFEDALVATNVVFTKEGVVKSRPPIRRKLGLLKEVGDTARLHQHWKVSRLGVTYYDNRWLYLDYDFTDGRIYDSGNATPSVPILEIAGMSWASIINIYGRLYISPLSDLGIPLTGSDGVIYVYDGTTCRKAGGSAPAGATLAITDTAVGGANVTAGLHIGAIAFETDTGFITPPGPATRIQVTIAAGGGRAARFTNVDVGPAGTVARHLLLTKTIPTYDGIQDNWELFFALRIPNNSATTGDVVVPDTGLVDSADYLLSEKAELPSCAAISVYGTHLMYNGIKTDQRVIYVSKGNDPETVDETEDYIQNFDGIPPDVLTGKELRGTYYFWKENTCFAVRESDAPPNEWQVDLVDSGLGALPAGIAEVMANPGGLVVDNLLVANFSGLFVFSGSYSPVPLSFKIQAIFDSFVRYDLQYLRMTVDPIKRRIYMLIGDPLDYNNDKTRLFVGDYYRGLDAQGIRWSEWAITLEETIIPFLGRASIYIEGIAGPVPAGYTYNIYTYPVGSPGSKVLFEAGTIVSAGAYPAVNFQKDIPGRFFNMMLEFEFPPQLDAGVPAYLTNIDGAISGRSQLINVSPLHPDPALFPLISYRPILDVNVTYFDGANDVPWPGATITVHLGPTTGDPVLDTAVTDANGFVSFIHPDLPRGGTYCVEVVSQAPPAGPSPQFGEDTRTPAGGIPTGVYFITCHA